MSVDVAARGTLPLLAQRFMRAGTFVYTVAVPLARLASVLPVPDPCVPFEGNRRVSLAHAKDFAAFWQSAQRWAVPPLIVDTPRSLATWFQPVASSDGLEAGVLTLPHHSVSGLNILDGQHRVLGWTLLADRPGDHHARLRTESVTVEIIEAVRLDDHRQYFYDIAVNARGISKSISAGFDKRAPLHRAAQRLSDEHVLLAGRVDVENDRVGSRPSMLLSLQNVVDLVTAVNVGVNGWVSEQRRASLDDETALLLADQALGAMTESFDDLADVAEGALTPGELRATSLLGSVSMLRALTGAYHSMAIRGGRLDDAGDDLARRVFALLNPHMRLPVADLWWASGAFESRDARGPRARRQDLARLTAFIERVADTVRREVPAAPSYVAAARPSAVPTRPPSPPPPSPVTPRHAPHQESPPRDVESADIDEDGELLPRLGTTDVPEDLFVLYRQQASTISLLTAEDEVALARQIEAGVLARERLTSGIVGERRVRRELETLAARGDEAFARFVTTNLRLVVSVAKSYLHQGVSFMDLIQEGNLGLIRAVHKFDWTTGNKFSTYATWWIRQAITRALADHGRTVRLPVHVAERVRVVRGTRRRLLAELDRAPTVAELSAGADMPEVEVASLLALSRDIWSLDEPITATTGERADATWSDDRWMIPLGLVVRSSNDDGPVDAVMRSSMHEDLRQVLGTLAEREAGVISLRFGLRDGEPKTLEEIGQVYGVTRERIRQIEKHTMEKLRHPSRTDLLRDYLEPPPPRRSRAADSSGSVS